MAKKSVQKVFNLKDLKSGMILSDSTRHPQDHEVDDDLIKQMRKFEQETNDNAVWKGRITGRFLYFRWISEHPEYLEQKAKSNTERMEKMRKAKVTKKEKTNIEELEEKEVEDEENLMLDAIEDYKTEFGVKSVNTKSKKFKAFFEEWKKSE